MSSARRSPRSKAPCSWCSESRRRSRPIDCELLHISLKNADRLIRLINDLLDISRLELGKIELTFTKVPTASLLEEAVAGLRAYAGGTRDHHRV